jgi:hypothetical protein
MEKAFDYCRHNIIEKVYEKFKFPQKLQNLITQIIRGNTTRVVTPWGLTELMDILSGSRQGDGLSVITYLLAHEAINRVIQQYCEGYKWFRNDSLEDYPIFTLIVFI